MNSVRKWNIGAGALCCVIFLVAAVNAFAVPGKIVDPAISIQPDPLDESGIPVSAAMSAEMVKVIQSVDVMMNGYIDVPKELPLFVWYQAEDAFFEPLDGGLHLPYQLKSGDKTKNPVFTRPIWAHEYGHAVFYHNLARFAPTYGKRFHYVMDYYRDLESGKTKVVDPEASIDFVEMRVYLAAYDELQADLFAVLLYNNPKVMKEALYITGGVREYNQAAVARDFDVARNAKNWKQEGIYTSLSPARSYIWKHYLDRPGLSTANKADILFKLLSAVGSEIESRYVNQLRDMSVEEQNTRLEQAVDRFLR